MPKQARADIHTFILSGYSLRIRAPTAWTDPQSEDVVSVLENTDIYAKCEEALRNVLKEHLPPQVYSQLRVDGSEF